MGPSTASSTPLDHSIAQGKVVYFPISGTLGADVIHELLGVLARHTHTPLDSLSIGRHADALLVRLAGQAPWASFDPRPGGEDGGLAAGARAVVAGASRHSIENVASKRGYWIARSGRFSATLDAFNPRDELGPLYRDATASTLMLWFSSPGLYDDITDARWLYDAMLEWDRILRPQAIVGTALMPSLMQAYFEKRIPSEVSPWSLLFPMTVVDNGDIKCSEAELHKFFAIVTPWPHDRRLLQLTPGLAGPLRVKQSKAAARLVDRVAAEELLEGRYPAGFRRSSEVSRVGAWPTMVRDDDSSASSIELISSPDYSLARQALYQARAGDVLQSRGHRIRALQVPLVTDRIRITIPIVIDREPQVDACVYTQCEPWTPARIANLRQWIADLRVASDSPVIVVANEHSAAVAASPDVEEFLVHRYDDLPTAP